MKPFVSFRGSFPKLLLVLTSVFATLLLAEAGLRIYSAQTVKEQPASVPLHLETNAPYLYTLNPEHDDISSQGTRDDEVAIPKPPGMFRILVLGDSIAYGPNVSRDQTFPNVLEAQLKKDLGQVEIINAAVSGYTPYNELQYYVTKGREFQPDLVIVAFCMNDVVNPRLHWGDAPNVKIPPEAIPNHDYDREHILPKLSQRDSARMAEPAGPPVLRHSELYKRIAPFVRRHRRDSRNVTGEVPTYITGEDTLSIEVLLNRQSPEWRWLAQIYDQLQSAVTADRAKLVIVVFPLAYQLNATYPHFPQKQFAEYCREKSVPCLDLLPAFRQRPAEEVFVLNNAAFYDVWHPTRAGYELTASELFRFLKEQKLLER